MNENNIPAAAALSCACVDPMCACRGGPCAECPEGQAIAAAPVAQPPAPSMDDAIAAGDGTLHGAIDHWQARALAAEAARDVDETNKVLADNYLKLTAQPPATAEAVAPAAWMAERDSMLRVRVMQGDVIANHVIAMQAALIDAAQVSPKEGLRWIFNTLRGPGFLPDMEEAKQLGSAQAWFDAKTAEHEAFRAANPGSDAAPAIVKPIDALRAAQEWIENSPHGDNCFVSAHYEGDPGDRCNCGKDSLLRYIEEAFTDGEDATPPAPAAALPPVARVPLTRERILALWGDRSDGPPTHQIISFARAVEASTGEQS